VNHVSSFFRRIASSTLFPKLGILWEILVILLCFVAFSGLTTWFVAYQVSQSQHKFCELIVTLSNAPAPPQAASGSQANPGRAFDEKIAQDILDLKRSLGC
jgi:hypothetical protein